MTILAGEGKVMTTADLIELLLILGPNTHTQAELARRFHVSRARIGEIVNERRPWLRVLVSGYPRMKHPCPTCGKPVRNSSQKTYCNSTCYEARPRKLVKVICAYCGIEFLLSGSDFRVQGKRNYRGAICCCHTHASKFMWLRRTSYRKRAEGVVPVGLSIPSIFCPT